MTMDVLLAPVPEVFMNVRNHCLAEAGFVVGPMGLSTATDLWSYAAEHGQPDPEAPYRFSFEPRLPGLIYESRSSPGVGTYAYVGIIDEIELNTDGHRYRFPKMKPGEGTHGEPTYDERMPAFVRFAAVESVMSHLSGARIDPGAEGLPNVLRHFAMKRVSSGSLLQIFDDLLARA